MACAAKGKAHFTYIWAIQNASVLSESKWEFSPVFVVKSMEMTKWQLSVDHFWEQSRLAVFIQRWEEDDGPESIELDFELSFLGVDGLPLREETGTNIFLRQSLHKVVLAEEDDVFVHKRAQFLPKDILTVRCRMWRKMVESSQADVCFVRKRAGCDRCFFFWTITNFSSLQIGQKRTRQLNSTSEGTPELILSFCLAESDGKEFLCVGIDRAVLMASCKVAGEIALLDAGGAVVHSEKVCSDFMYRPDENVWTSNKFFEKQKLLLKKSTLLLNDTLYLRCQFETDCHLIWSGIENKK